MTAKVRAHCNLVSVRGLQLRPEPSNLFDLENMIELPSQ